VSVQKSSFLWTAELPKYLRVLLRFQIQKNLDSFLFWPQMTLFMLPLQSWIAYGEDEEAHKALLKDFPTNWKHQNFARATSVVWDYD